MNLPHRIAAAALGIPFLWLGYEAAAEPGGRVQLAADAGVPKPELAVRFNGAAMALGGLGLTTGVLPRTAAVGLILSLVPTTVAGHAFWKEEDAYARQTQRIQVLKNLGLAGGLLAIALTRDTRPS